MTYTRTYVTCPDCGERLVENRETACEPAHYECSTRKGCGSFWSLAGGRLGGAMRVGPAGTVKGQ